MRFNKSVASAAFAVSLFVMPIMAATTTTAAATDTSELPNLSSVAASESSAAAASTKTTTSSDTVSTTAQSIAVITGGSTSTGKSASTSALPTLAGAYTIPTAAVPPTSNAPFMKESSYPEGTVFIAVGAVLGFMALSVLVWRMMVAWALHRSVKRAARQPSHVDKKQLFQAPPAPFYKYADKDSTLSLGGGGLGGKVARRDQPLLTHHHLKHLCSLVLQLSLVAIPREIVLQVIFQQVIMQQEMHFQEHIQVIDKALICQTSLHKVMQEEINLHLVVLVMVLIPNRVHWNQDIMMEMLERQVLICKISLMEIIHILHLYKGVTEGQLVIDGDKERISLILGEVTLLSTNFCTT
ncbi:hypothetical protein H4I95_06389 [Botrytis cinerea]